jgi:chromosome segregation ATPase
MNQQLLQRGEALAAQHDRVQAECRALRERHSQVEMQAQQHRELVDEKNKVNDELHREKEELRQRLAKMVEDAERKQLHHQQKTQFERVVECLDYRSIIIAVSVVCIVVGILVVLVNRSIEGRYCRLALEKNEMDLIAAIENYQRNQKMECRSYMIVEW